MKIFLILISFLIQDASARPRFTTTTVGTPGDQEVTRLDTSVATSGADFDTVRIIFFGNAGTNTKVCFWIDVDDNGSANGCGGQAARDVEITTLTSGMTPTEAVTALAAEISLDADFDATVLDDDLIVTAAAAGDFTDACADGASSAAGGCSPVGNCCTRTVTTQGTDSTVSETTTNVNHGKGRCIH